MTTLTQPIAISLVVAKLQNLALTVAGESVPVYDGPEGANNPAYFAVVMGEDPSDDTQARYQHVYLGNPNAMYENYSIYVRVFGFVGGDDSTADSSASDAQLTVRNNMATIVNAYVTAMNADPDLAIQNGGTAPVIWCLLRGAATNQQPWDSGMGRFANVRLVFDVFNVAS